MVAALSVVVTTWIGSMEFVAWPDGLAYAIAALLVGLDVDRPQENAQDAAALLDGLLMQRVIRASPAHEEAILTAYLTGLTDGRGEPLGG